MSNFESNDTVNQKVYNLKERTALFGEAVINFSYKIPKNTITVPLITQLVRAGTSIGANYCEADGAESNKDFIHKMGIAKKEAKETKYWLRMISTSVPELKEKALILWTECQELTLIFSSIINKARR